jgi:hypothetical protein
MGYMKRYKCLFIDWHLTLSNSIFWEHLSGPTHPHYSIFDTMQRMLFRPSAPGRCLLPWMRGQLTSEEVVACVCRGSDLDPDAVLQELAISCQQMRLVSEEIPDYVASLQAQGFRVVIATDNMDTFPRWTVPSLGLRAVFDDILCSSELKALKEDTSQDGHSLFFDRYLQVHQIGWGESVLLDDGDKDFGAIVRQFGIDYQHITPGSGLVPALQTLLASS